MMNSKVKVCADPLGNVVVRSQNSPEWGYVRVEQKVTTITDKGWLRSSTRSSLIKGKFEELVNAGFKKDMVLPGKLVVIESLNPFNSDNPDQHAKIAGLTNIPCTVDGQQIYRDCQYTTDETMEDILIQHDNTDAIKEAVAAMKLVDADVSLD